jgi:hypothetical protein
MVGADGDRLCCRSRTMGRAVRVPLVTERRVAGPKNSAGWLNRRIGAVDARVTSATGAPFEGHRDMTRPAEQAIVLEAALSPAVRNGDDVVRLPARAERAPGLPRGAIAGRRFGPRPFTVRFDDIDAAQLTRALVALLDLLPHIPGTAANLPLVHTRIPAEGAARGRDRLAAPAADGRTRLVPLGLAPLIGSDGTGATSAHEADIGCWTAER